MTRFTVNARFAWLNLECGRAALAVRSSDSGSNVAPILIGSKVW